MKKLFLPFAALLFFYSCENKKNDTKEEAVSTEKKADTAIVNEPNLTGCYMMTLDKDTAYMHLDDSAGYLTGHLSYKRFQKDANKGDVKFSKADNNKLKGWYNFNSEGKLSVREVVFEIMGSSLAEGYGDIGVKGDSVYFKYPVALKFEDKHPFIKTECK